MNKRILAFITVTTMLISSLSVFAEEITETKYMFWDFTEETSEYKDKGLSLLPADHNGVINVQNGVLEIGYESGKAYNFFPVRFS